MNQNCFQIWSFGEVTYMFRCLIFTGYIFNDEFIENYHLFIGNPYFSRNWKEVGVKLKQLKCVRFFSLFYFYSIHLYTSAQTATKHFFCPHLKNNIVLVRKSKFRHWFSSQIVCYILKHTCCYLYNNRMNNDNQFNRIIYFSIDIFEFST